MSKKKVTNILVPTFFSFKDALIQTYTLPYVKLIHKYLPAGSKIYLATLEKPSFALNEEEKKAALEELSEFNIEWVPLNYYPFGIKMLFNAAYFIPYLITLIFRKSISVIHPWCCTAGSYAYLLAVLTGRKLIIDSYEPHAEASVENGDWTRESFPFKLLFNLERLQSKKAHTVISATEGMRQYAKQKYKVDFERFYVKPACVDLDLFSEKRIRRPDLIEKLDFEDKVVCVYAGKFGGIYLDQEVFDFFKIAQDFWGDRFRVLLLTNQSDEQLQEWMDKSGVSKQIITKKFVQHADIPDYIGLGSFGLTPVKSIPTKRYCTPIKDGEYWALGLPVVITPNISDDSDIIERENIGAVIQELNPRGYLKAIQKIDELLAQNPQEMQQKVRNVAIQYRSFDIAKNIYQKIYANGK